ncbi:endoribonuclease Dicer-like [Oppia nitens]|uniref:endoribonuclease Dicer-like n=1 Tax=Oppia nitens TaxID=1686743 RepID=UPI0023DB887A|nr:endoribonuclease Dicer-like [Oppia nitens]
MASTGNEKSVKYKPHSYQEQLYMAAKDRNIIACLGTGTGKTFIAIMLMRDPKFAAALRGQYPQEAKRTVFIVPTRTLVTQQAAEVKRHFKARVKGYTGDMDVDSYDVHRWTTELTNQDVIVMTAQILLNMLNHQFITFDNINLMIMDEIHWAAKKKGKKESGHPYKQIMKLYNECPVDRRPRVLGLSASLINSSMPSHLFDAVVKDLEETYCAECNTSEVAKDCGTNPEEHICNFVSTPASPSPTARSVVQSLDLFIDNLNKLKKLKKIDGNSMITHTTSIKKCLTNVRNMLADPVNKLITNPETKQEYIITMTWMGVWCTALAIDKYISKLSQYRELYQRYPPHSALFDHVIRYLGLIKSQFNNELNPIQYPMAAYDTASPKMYQLLKILETYRPIDNEKSQFSGIVFVAQRSVAKVLAEWLNKIKELKPTEFGFLNVDSVVGNSYRPGFESSVTSYIDKQQEGVINRFRNGSLNLIIATSVLEEGLDIPKCNVVIRYDRLNTFREYLQSKGRARAKNASYYMMTSEEDRDKLENQLKDFADIEKHIENLNNISKVNGAILSPFDDEEDEDDNEQYIDDRTGARVTSRTSISLIYRYCALLTSDSFTKLMPVFNIEGIDKPFRYSLKLPVNSPLKETIYGQWCKSKKGAKKSIAFEVCKQLHLLGELNERFLPISREQLINKYVEKLGLSIRDIDKEDSDVAKVGTRARNQIYEKRLAQVFTSQVSSNFYYLHRISMKFPSLDCFNGQYMEFGLITGDQIVNRCSFSVFAPIREYQTMENNFAINVDFMPLTKLSFNESQLEVIRKFHLFTFEEVIGIDPNGQLVFNTGESQFNLLVVPLMTNKQIDWKFMDKVNNCEPIQLKTLSTTERSDFKFDAQLYKDCVFYPWYWQPDNPRPERPTLYDSLSVTNLTPMSPWKGKDEQYKTFEHYYLKKHNLEINNKSQQLLEGKMVKKLSQIKSFTLEKSDPNRIPQYFVPELVYIHPFPSSLWRQALCLPAVLYRLNHIFLTEELRQKIHLETKPHIGCLNSPINELSLTLSSDIIEFPLIGIKRLLIDDIRINCEGHPLDSTMDMNEIKTFVMPKMKKQRTDYAISVTSNVTKLGSNSIITNLSPVNNNNNNCINRLLDFTEAVIKKFNDIFNNIRESNIESDSDKYELEILSAKSESQKDSELKYGETYPFIFTGNIMPYIERSYDCRVGEPIIGPSADVLLKALTLLNANDAFNLERLETMGDSFLKFATTAFLYYACPELDEGRLSYLRQIQICNCNLYYLGNRKGIANLLVAHKWYPKINWLPPSYHIDDECDLQLLTKTNDGYRYQLVNDKSIADSVEALIGAHLLVGGTKCALIFMEWLGLKISTKKDIDYLNIRKLDDSKQFQWLPEPKNPIWNTSATEYDINKFIMNEYTDCYLNNFEKIIDYTFNNKAFIIQAFTHSSNIRNQFTDCYQRLEFLGDSVLDYLITYHIYNIADKKFSPGELTDLRSALVNNTFFANIAVKFNFHKYLKAFSLELYHSIDVFVKKFETEKQDSIYHCFKALTDEEVTDLEEVEIPKALGDIFESIAGAIYLDSGLSLDAVWKVFYKLLKPEIDYFSDNIPIMPVRELREKCESVEFSKGEQLSDGKIRVVLSANGHQYSGIGKNSKLAKIAASKSALKAISLDKK